MNIITSGLSGALAFALAATAMAPAIAAPIKTAPTYQASSDLVQVQYNNRRDRDGERRDRFERRGSSAFYNNHRGYRERRAGYRQYNGFWFPPAAFIAGAIIGGALNDGPRYQPRATYRVSNQHVAWCQDRWRSYRVSDNTYQPNSGPRRVCTSPFG
jgi:hypothetical protein